jgi:flagellar basal-body rod modification protein FlgD
MPIEGIVDQDFINQQVALTSQNSGSGSAGNFDPDMFLKILMTQLQNQSPFDTVDSQQILEQQAILTQVEQSTRQTGILQELQAEITTINENLSQINETLKGL